uniref:Uncharacterized protein n=1 Tax=Daucus carota subsp. sativus TaxID=79200 RepID=A0A164WVQ3_DAUCS
MSGCHGFNSWLYYGVKQYEGATWRIKRKVVSLDGMQHLPKACAYSNWAYIGQTTKGRSQLSFITSSLIKAKSPKDLWKCNFTTSRKMMMDTSEASGKGQVSIPLPEKDDNGTYASGGLKR